MSKRPPEPVIHMHRHLNGLRDFGRTFTHSALGRERSPEKCVKLVRKLDLVADNAIQEFTSALEALQGKAPHLRVPACRKGCDHCCYQDVGATMPELISIAEYVRENFSDPDLVALVERLKAYGDAHRNRKETDARLACPLLVNSMCSVHPARPLACRAFNSVDVEKCIEFKGKPGAVWDHSNMVRELWVMALNVRDGMQAALHESSLDATPAYLGLALLAVLEVPDFGDNYLGSPKNAAIQDQRATPS